MRRVLGLGLTFFITVGIMAGISVPDSARAAGCVTSHEGSLNSKDQFLGVEAGGGCGVDGGDNRDAGGETEASPTPSETNTRTMNEARSGQEDNPSDPGRTIAINQVYCTDIQGVAMMDCLEAEQSACGPEGQWVIRAEYPANNEDALERVGSHFCSTDADPVIDDPVAGAPDAPPMPVVTLSDFRSLGIAPSQIESDSGGFGLIRANTNIA